MPHRHGIPEPWPLAPATKSLGSCWGYSGTKGGGGGGGREAQTGGKGKLRTSFGEVPDLSECPCVGRLCSWKQGGLSPGSVQHLRHQDAWIKGEMD